MADYYSILKKTIASLPENNGAARRSVYSRARNAIVNQLKAYEPPLSPSEITSEQLRLEEAIRKVEAEAARESLGLSPASAVGQERQTAAVAAPQPEQVADQQPAPESAPAAEPGAPAASDAETPSPLKDTLSEAQSLGGAASQAVQQAKDAGDPAADKTPAGAAPVRKEPAFNTPAPGPAPEDERLFEPSEEADAGLYASEPAPGTVESERKASGRARKDRPKASDALRDDASAKRILPIAIAAVLALAVVGTGAYFLLPGGEETAGDQQSVSNVDTSPVDLASTEPEAPADSDESSKNTDRLLNGDDTDVVAPDARTVTTTTISPQGPDAETAPAGEPAPDLAQPSIVTNVESEPDAAEPDVVSPQQPESAATPLVPAEDSLAAVAPEEPVASNAPAATSNSGVQKSILYEQGEDEGDAGTAAQGAVVWSVEEETNLDGKTQSVLNAEIEIPERDVKVGIRIKPNDDTSLPASHLVEIRYEFPESFAAGDVVNVPGIVMKPTEEARGDALIGASVKVSPGYFWIALSSLPNEQQRNLALLRERGWIDIPMLYESGKRGILTLEKGAAGTEAVEKAVSSWLAG